MFIKYLPKFDDIPTFHIRWFCGKTTFWRITQKPCPPYDLMTHHMTCTTGTDKDKGG